MRQEEEHEEHDGLGLHARRPSLERQSQTISEEGEGPRGQASASEQQPGRGGVGQVVMVVAAMPALAHRPFPRCIPPQLTTTTTRFFLQPPPPLPPSPPLRE